MKKAYAKPEIMFESFTISTNIAAGCTYKSGLSVSEQNCGYLFGGDRGSKMIFLTYSADDTGCKTVVPDGYNGMCYHNPSDGFENIFNS